MRIAHRLFLSVLPAVLGVLLVAALAYWGQRQRAAPRWIVVVAGITAIGSLVVAWRNTRYVAERIERLAGQPRGEPVQRSPIAAVWDAAMPRAGATPDELDSVATELDRLSTEAVAARDKSRRREQLAAQRVQEYAALLAEGASAVARQLDEVRLPLQILLDNHFGQLNENQEEMLGAARQAADVASVELQRLREIASIDQGALTLRREPIQVAELLRGLLPGLRAEGERRGVEVKLDIVPGLPRVLGDCARLQEAIELLLRYVARHADSDRSVRITGDRGEQGGVVIEVAPAPMAMLGPDVALASRVVAAHGGSIEPSRDGIRVLLPPGDRL